MHLSGKIAAVLTMIAILVAPIFTAKLIQVRNGWTRKAVALSAKLEADQAKLERAQAQADILSGEYFRVMLPWNKTFSPVNTAVTSPAEGKLTIDLGSTAGLKEKQWLYGYELKADETSAFRGVFEVAGLRENQALLQPNWRVRPGDTAGWKPGAWRWRPVMPTGYVKELQDLELRLVKADELLADREQSQLVQERLLEEATAQQNLRIAEIKGGQELPQSALLPTEFRKGLVAALVESEEQRNAELVEVDRLRRTLRDLARQMDELLEANTRLSGQLPKPVTDTALKGDGLSANE